MYFAHLAALFFAKVLDNAFGTTKTILVQRGRSVLAGAALAASNFINYCITKNIVTSDSMLAIVIVSIASGVGCCLAIVAGARLSRDRTYVNVVMSDDRPAMQSFRDFLAQHHITNVAADSYTRDWARKTITVTAYADTKAQSKLIDAYIQDSPLKFKRAIQKA